MSNFLSFAEFILEAVSKDKHYYWKDRVVFFWHADTKIMNIMPNDKNVKSAGFEKITIKHIDHKLANDIIGMLNDHEPNEWFNILKKDLHKIIEIEK